LPVNTNTIVSPFIGGGSFELFCVSEFDTVIYGADVFSPLVYFWNHLIEDNDELIEKIRNYLPLVSKEDYYKMQRELGSLTDTLEIATYFFVLNRCSFSGNVAGGFTSYNINKTKKNPRFNEAAVERLAAFKSLDNKFNIALCDFEQTLGNYDNGEFTYLDPPYLINNKIYGARGDSVHQIDHNVLYSLLKKRQGPWLLSYNNCDTIKDMYKDFFIIDDINWGYGMSKDKTSKELLILSPSLEDVYKRRQLKK